MSMTRRTLLGAAAAAGLVTATGRDSFAVPSPSLVADLRLPTIADNGNLALPRGFRAVRVGTVGVEPLLDDRFGSPIAGAATPSNLDGTGAFDAAGAILLVRNHECRADSSVPVPLVAGTVYDAGIATGMGGNTVVETKPDGTFVRQWVGLSGTIRNCAGGETPWGSWLSCEEDTTKAGTRIIRGGRDWGTTEQDHGYVFEVFPDVVAKQVPIPIKAWGRAVWEGAAIGPKRTSAYLTEDAGGGLFYRWLAPEGEVIGPRIAEQFGENDGVLQGAQLVKDGTALVHYGQLTAADLNRPYPIVWIDGGADRQAQTTDLRKQFPGATVHPKIEGCWSDGTGLWIALAYTNGAQATAYPTLGLDQDWGMVMFYDYAEQSLTLKEYYAEGNSQGAVAPGHATEDIKQFHGPDNITAVSYTHLTLPTNREV